MVTGCYAGPPAECPRVLWDFAFAGADIDPTMFARRFSMKCRLTRFIPSLTPHTDWIIDMTEQVNQWIQAWNNKLLKVPQKSSLAAFFIGINDTSDVKGWTNVS